MTSVRFRGLRHSLNAGLALSKHEKPYLSSLLITKFFVNKIPQRLAGDEAAQVLYEDR
jgi:hypothetical protein